MLFNSHGLSPADCSIILDAELLVIDLESRPLDREDPLNGLVAKARDQVFLNTITAAAVLMIGCAPQRRPSLHSFSGPEPEILGQIDAVLRSKPEYTLLSFNGIRFDLPLLQVRALHRGLVNLCGIGAVRMRGHIDLMRTTGRLTSLEALAGALNLLDTMTPRGAMPEEKCRSDVVLTYLAAVHLAAFAMGDVHRIGDALEDCTGLSPITY